MVLGLVGQRVGRGSAAARRSARARRAQELANSRRAFRNVSWTRSEASSLARVPGRSAFGPGRGGSCDKAQAKSPRAATSPARACCSSVSGFASEGGIVDIASTTPILTGMGGEMEPRRTLVGQTGHAHLGSPYPHRDGEEMEPRNTRAAELQPSLSETTEDTARPSRVFHGQGKRPSPCPRGPGIRPDSRSGGAPPSGSVPSVGRPVLTLPYSVARAGETGRPRSPRRWPSPTGRASMARARWPGRRGPGRSRTCVPTGSSAASHPGPSPWS